MTTQTVELNEQQIVLIKHFLEQVITPLENYSKSTQVVAQQIINKLEEE